MQSIFILGGTTFDHIVHLEQFPVSAQTIHKALFYETTGSTGAGKALCLAKLGVSNSLYSVLGNDEWGKKITSYLQSQKVDLFFDIDPAGTERHINIMNAEGERISMFITQSSEQLPIHLDKIEEKIKEHDILVLNIISYCKQLIPLVKKYNKPVWTDLHDYNKGNPYHQPFIDASRYVFLSSDNLPSYRPFMQQLIDEGKELVVCTHGKNGATALTKDGKWVEQPALTSFKMVDANGAGDNFFAGFMYAYLLDQRVEICMQYGTLCAAYCITSQDLVFNDLSSEFIRTKHTEYFASFPFLNQAG
jgi:acarbose 7IV-phosphotransferase